MGQPRPLFRLLSFFKIKFYRKKLLLDFQSNNQNLNPAKVYNIFSLKIALKRTKIGKIEAPNDPLKQV